MSQNEFNAWIRDVDNGLHVQSTVESFNLDVQFVPEKIKDGPGSLKKIILKVGLTDHEDLLKYNAADFDSWQRNNYYYSFLFQNDLFLEVDGQRTPCALYHFEKSIDSENRRTFHLMFDEPSENKDFYLVIDSEKLYSLPVRLRIRNSDLPTLAKL